jgi:hypothetical protein
MDTACPVEYIKIGITWDDAVRSLGEGHGKSGFLRRCSSCAGRGTSKEKNPEMMYPARPARYIKSGKS